jgi:hypothetical protein
MDNEIIGTVETEPFEEPMAKGRITFEIWRDSDQKKMRCTTAYGQPKPDLEKGDKVRVTGVMRSNFMVDAIQVLSRKSA